LVSIPATASLVIWDRNHDLIIPLSEIRSISVLDSRAKREIMMGWTCCYHPTLINQVYQQQSEKLIEYRLKANEKKLLSIPLYPEPTQKQFRLFWALSAIDVALTYHALKTPGIKEANPLLGSKPSLGRLIAHKALLGPIVVNNSNTEQQVIVNTLLGFAVANNMRIISKKKAW